MQKKIILITGCSTGIGHDAVIALTQRGHQVIASCRKQADVNNLQALGIETVCMDVADPLSIAKAFTDVLEKTGGRLDVVINNAGYGQAGALEDVPYHALCAQFATNVFGLMELTRLAIPIMRQQQQGRIINISSLLGIVSMPFRGAYNASKYAVEGLSDTLRLELKPSGIDVITIEPGPIESQFRDNALDNSLKKIDLEHSHFHQRYKHMLGAFRQRKSDSMFTKSTAVVIKKLIHAIESSKPKAKYPVTLPTYFFIILKRLLSVRMLDSVITYISRKE
jgi:NAD(P)-dependent dehydrogenase (short-subunit alcohol dehydrogenase family)